jgi:hypothetical protein
MDPGRVSEDDRAIFAYRSPRQPIREDEERLSRPFPRTRFEALPPAVKAAPVTATEHDFLEKDVRGHPG